MDLGKSHSKGEIEASFALETCPLFTVSHSGKRPWVVPITHCRRPGFGLTDHRYLLMREATATKSSSYRPEAIPSTHSTPVILSPGVGETEND